MPTTRKPAEGGYLLFFLVAFGVMMKRLAFDGGAIRCCCMGNLQLFLVAEERPYANNTSTAVGGYFCFFLVAFGVMSTSNAPPSLS